MSSPATIEALWKHTTDAVKKEIMAIPLWRAMEMAHPITVEGDELVLGFSSEDYHQSGVLSGAQYRNIIQRILREATKKDLRIRLISGTTLDDWEHDKARAVEAERLEADTKQRRMQRLASDDAWEDVGDALIRDFAAIPDRRFAANCAPFVDQALDRLADAHQRLHSDAAGDQDPRGYTRVLERVGDRLEVGPIILGWMVLQRLKERS